MNSYKGIKMTPETQNPDPSTVLCKVIDVNQAVQNSFKKFLDSEGKTLDELANILRDEMSQIELFVSSAGELTA